MINHLFTHYLQQGQTRLGISLRLLVLSIRGWMLGMNRAYVKDTTSTSNWFGFDLGYDKTAFTVNGTGHNYTAAQYNGNINGLLWRSTGDDFLRKYDFIYDAVNRFTAGDFNQLNSNSFNKTAKIDFSVFGMTYDANGNILTMNQKGWKLGGSVTIDSLLYSYASGSNRLQQVMDRKNDSLSKLGDFKYFVTTKSATDYMYDANGNMISDANKAISAIDYNHLNLPQQITVGLLPGQAYGGGTIIYTHDATGAKISKTVTENPSLGISITRTINYLGGFVYESVNKTNGGNPDPANYVDRLQYLMTEEGRARVSDDSSRIIYDFMIKDHLGSVRMILTEETDTGYYPPASMEERESDLENRYYSNIEETRYKKPSGFGDQLTDPDEACAVVIADDNRLVIGPAIALRVMAGDKFNLRVSSYWASDGPVLGLWDNPLPYLLSGLTNSVGGITMGHGGPAPGELQSAGVFSNGAQAFLNGQSYSGSGPRAYINWILFDDRFNYVAASSGFEQVGADGATTIHVFNNQSIIKNGYLYVYLSNSSSETPVFFDNLQVTHIRGPLLEESHYYPFGLTMAGISSKALNGVAENKKKYNGIEYEKSFDLNIGEAFFRTHDPQLGRWWQIDPKPNEFESPYVAMGNNPIFKFDVLGDTVYNANAADDAAIVQWIAQGLNLKKGQANPFSFNDDGELQVNQKSFNKLSKAQKKASQNVVDAINSKDLLEIQLVDNKETLETETVKLGKNEVAVIIGGKSYKDGDVVNQTIEDYGGGRVKPPVINGNGQGSNYILAQIARQSNTATVAGANGSQIAMPNYAVLFHEAFGHFVYHYIQNSCTQNQQTIDYENSIRQLRNLPLRSGTDHPKDKDY